VIVVETERELRVPGYEAWWDVAVAEVSENASVRAARASYEEARKKQRYHW
jgi:3D-(3,5/4)-trihydroxycyclohexane-1,2-dione acylhydrolase (decyclizing)